LFHELFVYEKVRKKYFFGLIKYDIYNLLSESILINTVLDTKEIKKCITEVLIGKNAFYKMKEWDGFVGNIPEDFKKSFIRDSKIKNILK
jgi:hypothetical protein